MGSDTDALLWTRRHFVCDNTENYAVDKGNPMGAPAGETYLQLQSGAACLLLPAEPGEAEVPVTARAAHLASLLPGIAAAVLGTLLAFNCGAALSKAKDERIAADPASIVETIYH